MSADHRTLPRPPAIFLMGPTAAGKTRLAVELTRHLPCEIVSVDSALVYRGMDIGTAKPDPATLAAAPHHLIDILDPTEPYSAARFREDANRVMAEITARGRIPLLVGGTMLYYRALERGLADLPPADTSVRERLALQARIHGWVALHDRLREVDPIAAGRIHPNDPQRIQRALEVYELTGKPITKFLTQRQAQAPAWDIKKLIALHPNRGALRERIRERFEKMLEQGLVDEVRRLRSRGDLSAQLPSMRAVGYRQVWHYLEGMLSYEAMSEAAVLATRQLAKRQLTWLRAETGAERFDVDDQDIVGNILKYIARTTIYDDNGGQNWYTA